MSREEQLEILARLADGIEQPVASVAERYFLDQGNSSHWYIVQASRREDWERWRDLPEDDEAGWEAPDYANRIGGHPGLITFTDPKEKS